MVTDSNWNVKIPRFLEVAGEGVDIGDSLESTGGEATVVSSEGKTDLVSAKTTIFDINLFTVFRSDFDDNLLK